MQHSRAPAPWSRAAAPPPHAATQSGAPGAPGLDPDHVSAMLMNKLHGIGGDNFVAKAQAPVPVPAPAPDVLWALQQAVATQQAPLAAAPRAVAPPVWSKAGPKAPPPTVIAGDDLA